MKTYLRANQPYWFDLPENIGDRPISLVRLNLKPDMDNGLHTFNNNVLNQIGITTPKKGNYFLYRDDELIVVAPEKEKIFIFRGPQDSNFYRMYGNYMAQAFRNNTKSKLIKTLSDTSGPNSTDTVIGAFRDYTYFDAFSVWLFNDITEIFTRIAGDVSPTSHFVEIGNYNILKNGLNTRDTLHNELNSTHWKTPDILPKELTWVNVFSVATTGTVSNLSLKVVVCMYTRYPEYNLRNDTCNLIRSFLQQNLADRYFDRLLRLNNVRAQIGGNLKLDSPYEFLKTVVKSVAADLLWETCSIFLRDSNDGSVVSHFVGEIRIFPPGTC